MRDGSPLVRASPRAGPGPVDLRSPSPNTVSVSSKVHEGDAVNERHSNPGGALRSDGAMVRLDAVAQGETPLSSPEGRLARRLLAMAGDPPVRLVLWNGDSVGTADEPVATLHIGSRGTLARLLWNPDLYLGESYTDGSVVIEGDLPALLEAIYRSRRHAAPPSVLRRSLLRALDRRRSNTLDASRENIHRHYDLGNAFYRLWLDREMVYTCAYFPTRDATLEAAQVAKMDHVCRKLRLRPGERVIEAGCGWGGFALHAATHYGVQVRAFNISTEQIAWARERARELGVHNSVEFVQEDYREIAGRCDAFVSIGMLEHVGVETAMC